MFPSGTPIIEIRGDHDGSPLVRHLPLEEKQSHVAFLMAQTCNHMPELPAGIDVHQLQFPKR